MPAPETEHRPSKPLRSWMNAAAALFLWAEHAAYMVLGLLLAITALIALAGVIDVMLHGISDWSGTRLIIEIIERLLFVLMLIEIMHTVRASLSSGTLKSEPFLVVGLIASIRRVLVITLESSDLSQNANGSPAAAQMFRDAMVELGVPGRPDPRHGDFDLCPPPDAHGKRNRSLRGVIRLTTIGDTLQQERQALDKISVHLGGV